MKFDGYGATVRGQNLDRVAGVVTDALTGMCARGKPRRRYVATVDVHVGPRMGAWLGVDGTSGDIYIEGKGETTPALVQAIRAEFPDHSAPRIDVCEDYDEPGAFERLQGLVRASKGPRVKGGYVALPDDLADGRTWAAGVRGGVGYIRTYEAGKHPDRVHLGRPDWARIELECRPHYAKDKRAAASMSPVDVWGLAGWTHRVGEALTQCELHRFAPEVRRYSHDKTTRYIALTFRRHIEEMLANGEHLEATIRDVWAEEDAYRKTPAGRRH